MEIEVKDRADTIKVQTALLSIMPELDKGKTFDVTIKQHREKRSKNANDYFHLLVHKIADAMRIGNEECKKIMNLEYGTPKRLDEHTLFALKVPSGSIVEDIVKYPKFIRTDIDNGKSVDIYVVYKETHTLNTQEMSRLIDGVVQEAQNLDIETRTPDELAEMLSLWEQGKR